MRRTNPGWALAALYVSLVSTTINGADERPDTATLRPTGPVTISADRAEWEKGGAMVYTGKVQLESGELKLTGDRLQLRQLGDGQFEAKVSGDQAALDHKGILDRDGKVGPPVHAQANLMTYDSRAEQVELSGGALLRRGTDKINGENIRYDVARRRIEAGGGPKGQVRIEMQPPPRKSDAGEPVPPAGAKP